jgi:hypothetical protein
MRYHAPSHVILLSVIGVHGDMRPLGEPGESRVRRLFDGGIERDSLVATGRTEQKVDIFPTPMQRTPNADFDTGEGVGREVVDDRL